MLFIGTSSFLSACMEVTVRVLQRYVGNRTFAYLFGALRALL